MFARKPKYRRTQCDEFSEQVLASEVDRATAASLLARTAHEQAWGISETLDVMSMLGLDAPFNRMRGR